MELAVRWLGWLKVTFIVSGTSLLVSELRASPPLCSVSQVSWTLAMLKLHSLGWLPRQKVREHWSSQDLKVMKSRLYHVLIRISVRSRVGFLLLHLSSPEMNTRAVHRTSPACERRNTRCLYGGYDRLSTSPHDR